MKGQVVFYLKRLHFRLIFTLTESTMITSSKIKQRSEE